MDASVETVNAAANAIVSAESRVQQVTVSRKRWGAFLSMYWCFGSKRNEKRIGHAVLVPEPTLRGSDVPAPENPHPPRPLPFTVPPSSPASFLQSDPPSATQSPVGFLSFSALSQNSYSPSGPSSIFAIGPYANETQLVSPPAFTTESSTAPLTPPPESVQLTTPSSPEVPFAKLLSSSFSTNGEAYEFQSYQLYPGSPIGHLISPSSVSGTSSPFPDPDTRASLEPPKLLTGDDLTARKRIPIPSRANGSLVDGEIVATTFASDNSVRPGNDEPVVGHRVSFELTAEEVTRCMERKPAMPNMPEELRRAASVSAAKEFKFNNADGADAEPEVGSDWWVQGKVAGAGAETGTQKNWAFFPMIQPGVS